LDYTKVIILILWWRNFQLEYWRTFQLVSTMSFIKEILTFIVNEKKWWLAPLIFILLIVSLLVIFADSAVAPFIYSLF